MQSPSHRGSARPADEHLWRCCPKPLGRSAAGYPSCPPNDSPDRGTDGCSLLRRPRGQDGRGPQASGWRSSTERAGSRRPDIRRRDSGLGGTVQHRPGLAGILARAATASSAPARSEAACAASSSRAARGAGGHQHPGGGTADLKDPSAATTSVHGPTAAGTTPGAPDPGHSRRRPTAHLGAMINNAKCRLGEPTVHRRHLQARRRSPSTPFSPSGEKKEHGRGNSSTSRCAGRASRRRAAAASATAADRRSVTSSRCRAGPGGRRAGGAGDQNGLLGALAGIRAGHRDASFLLASSHLRTFRGRVRRQRQLHLHRVGEARRSDQGSGDREDHPRLRLVRPGTHQAAQRHGGQGRDEYGEWSRWTTRSPPTTPTTQPVTTTEWRR